MSPATCFYFDQTKILLSGNGLNLTKRQILDSSELKEFADDDFKFDEQLA